MTGTNLFIFGDSLSDTGNFRTLTGGFIPPSPPYFDGRFSNGPVAVDILTTQPDLGLTLNPLNNFALAGATTGRGNSNEDDLGRDLPGLLDQVDAFTARVGAGGADPNGLYLVWAGPNNFLDPLGGTTSVDPAELLRQGALDLTQAAKTLAGLGAKKIVLPNLVNLGLLPASQKFRVEATAVSQAFNAAVVLELGNLNFAVTEVDLFAVGEAVAANPASFGFSNITDPLLLQGFPPPPNAAEFFFWDQFHPTTQAHALFANTIRRTLTGEIPQPSFTDRRGTARADVLVGTSARDNMDGFAGVDLLVGAQADDRLEGWNGDDRLLGNQGSDVLSGGEGADSIFGGTGQDIGFGGNGNDRLFGLLDDDILVGDAGQDLIKGELGNDYLLGGDGEDVLWGNGGEDILNGGLDGDQVWGGDGNDSVNGGADADQLAGGRGRDQFVYRRGNGQDRIIDFSRGQDQINLASFGFASFTDFTAKVEFNRNSINFGNGDTLQLVGINTSNLSAADFLFA